ncbi:MAG: alpha-amylase [Melioribacteraceae bacterium]|nr:alpha-amylase [Melioribacteraceae bacterium]MCF8264177.1 alpha-amylase [Melioribacteraceae bacterium]MCF8430509.1 alpha-amylase [Melioribacteraceae bacterium]
MNIHFKSLLTLLLLFLFLIACNVEQNESNVEIDNSSGVVHPEWSYDATIYEANIRQFSEEGTFNAFSEGLPAIKNMGVDIIWLMPIHPIGEKNRKGSLGSYYAVKNYLGVNPEFGTEDDLRNLVNKIHEMGMYVIIDWVANHSSWDNPLTVTNPEFYTTDENGNFVPPVEDWADVIDFNYDNPGLRRYMTDALLYWVKEFNIDGYRCDVAGMVPTDFWEQSRKELDEIKPVFMLAEAGEPELQENAFDMTYNWQLKNLMNEIAAGEKNALNFNEYLAEELKTYDENYFRMVFTTNHDENSWDGTVFERLGEGYKTFAVLTGTVNGMPLIYSGQEAGLDKRLQFFEKDPIEWKDHPIRELYTKLFNLKKNNQALWNGKKGGSISRINTDNDENVLIFKREKGENIVVTILNLSDESQKATVLDGTLEGNFKNLFSETEEVNQLSTSHQLKPWEYQVWFK